MPEAGETATDRRIDTYNGEHAEYWKVVKGTYLVW